MDIKNVGLGSCWGPIKVSICGGLSENCTCPPQSNRVRYLNTWSLVGNVSEVNGTIWGAARPCWKKFDTWVRLWELLALSDFQFILFLCMDGNTTATERVTNAASEDWRSYQPSFLFSFINDQLNLKSKLHKVGFTQ